MSASRDDGEVTINGRPAQDWEVPLIEAARAAKAERDAQVIDGIRPYPTSPDAGIAAADTPAREPAKRKARRQGPFTAIGP